MPYVDIAGNDITSPVISGGTELFSRLVYKNFDVEVVNVPWTTTNDQNKQLIAHIREVAHDKKCDVIMSNNIKSVCFRSLRDIGIPMFHITHTNYGLLKANYLLNQVYSYGHSIFGVSQSNIGYMQKMSKRIGEECVPFSGTISPAYCMYDLPVLEANNDVVTIGRSNSYKLPFIISKKIKEKYNPVVITSLGVDHDSIDYYERNKHLPHFIDLPHETVIEYLRNAAASVVTCTKETFGITALESLSLGVPVVIRTDKSGIHASSEIAADRSHFKTVHDEPMVKCIDELVKVDRNAIKQATQEKHSLHNWKRKIENAADLTIERYKTFGKANGSLEDFFG